MRPDPPAEAGRGPVLGTQRLSLLQPAERDARIEQAISGGVAWLDTADVYGTAPGDAERALAPCARRVAVATKGGLVRTSGRWLPDGRPGSLIAAATASVERLEVDALDLWWWHAPDPRVPIARSLNGIASIAARGLARHIGLCNATVGTLRAALDRFPVAALQVELSPLRDEALYSGVIAEALRHGIPVWAYRPLGGADGVKKLVRNPTLAPLARDLGVSPAVLVFRWLFDLGLIPLPGPTSAPHLQECLGYRDFALPDDVRVALDAAFAPGRLRSPRPAPAPDADGEVVLIMGSPGAGKSTRIASYPEHLRLNRDQRGGTLSDLLEPLDGALAAGRRRVVLDNTYPSRAARARIIEVAWRHGVPVRLEWLQTDPDDAEVNLVERILQLRGALPEPDELSRARDPQVVGPRALHRYRETLEEPTLDEGFARIDQVAFTRRPSPFSGRALLLDPRDLLDADRLRPYLADGFRLAVLGWGPEGPQATVARAEALGFDVYVGWCPHPAGPPRCWCRKPLPGLGVLALRALSASPVLSRALGSSPADRGLARKLGVPLVTP